MRLFRLNNKKQASNLNESKTLIGRICKAVASYAERLHVCHQVCQGEAALILYSASGVQGVLI